MHSKALWIALLASEVYGGLLNPRQSAPTATLKDGNTIVGSTSSGVDSFLGIPFAQPPIGNLRMRPPRPRTVPLGTFQATAPPAACPQVTQPSVPTISEDCLTINVHRPSTVSGSSRLPVLVFFFGGGFIAGSAHSIDGPFFVRQAVAKNAPYLVLAMDYRVNGFGFLGGKELAREGSTNLGLRDQRLALQWVQQNVAAFGGDPAKVTLWGLSAGAISVMDQTIIQRGNHTFNGQPLFRGAMMSSGTIIPAREVDSPRAQALFDQVANTSGCGSSANKPDCLRQVPFNDLLNNVLLAPGRLGYTSIDFAYIPRPDNRSDFFPASPEDAIKAGQYARVPVITGTMEDEGTGFVQQANITTNEQLTDILQRHWAGTTRDDIRSLLAAYPDDLAAGSPFRTGSANNIYPKYKRLAAIRGDTTFTLTTRAYLSIVSGAIDTYSYIGSFLYGSGPYGTPHSADFTAEQLPNPGVIIPRDAINTYFTSFVNYLDPNRIPSQFRAWPKYTGQHNPVLLNYSISDVNLISNDFRSAQYQAFMRRLHAFRL